MLLYHFCFNFVLFGHLDTQVMLILILIDIQYSQKAVFSCEKGSNGQNHSSSGLHHLVKKSRNKISNPPTPYLYLENPASSKFGHIIGFPTGVENMREALQNLMGGGEVESIHKGSMWGLKMLLENTCEGVHLLVKLPAVSLQACKFTINELFYTYFSRILARF